MKRNIHSKSIYYNGCYYSSRLELKYALWVETWCAYLVHPIKIYSGTRIGDAIDLSKFYKVYVPDFLVRNWKNNKAWLVEVKPLRYLAEAMRKKEMVLEYLKIKNLDWNFIIATEKDIHLSESQYKKYKRIIDDYELLKKNRGFSFGENRYRNRHTDGFNQAPQLTNLDIEHDEYITYVKTGKLPKRVISIDEILVI
jgi:hypothetical protein